MPMVRKKHILLILILLFCNLFISAQTEISGIINSYAVVTDIFSNHELHWLFPEYCVDKKPEKAKNIKGKLLKASTCRNCGEHIEHYFEGEDGWRHFEEGSFYYNCRKKDSVRLDIHAEPVEKIEEPWK